MKYLNYILVFCFMLLTISYVLAQSSESGAYHHLQDASGVPPTYLPDVFIEAESIVADLIDTESKYKVDYAKNFSFVDYGFYLHNESMKDGLDFALSKAIEAAESKSKYYVLFAKESNAQGIYSKVHVKANLGEALCGSLSPLDIENIFQQTFNSNYIGSSIGIESAIGAVIEKFSCLVPENWYSCADRKNSNSFDNDEFCDPCDEETQIITLEGKKFVEFKLESADVLLNPVSHDEIINQEFIIPGVNGTYSLESLLSFSNPASHEILISADCDFYNYALSEWNALKDISWVHIVGSPSSGYTAYFASQNPEDKSTNSSHYSLDRFYEAWTKAYKGDEPPTYKDENTKQFLKALEDSPCRDAVNFLKDAVWNADKGHMEYSVLMKDALNCVFNLLNLDCNADQLESFESPGIVPYCLWKGTNLESRLLYYSGVDYPFMAGVVDGIYNEIHGITNLVFDGIELATAIQQSFYCHVYQRIKDAEYENAPNYKKWAIDITVASTNLLEPLGDLAIEHVNKVWGSIPGREPDLLKSCEGAKGYLDNFTKGIHEIIGFLKNADFVEIIGDQATKFYEQHACENNECRYKHGRTAVTVISLLNPKTIAKGVTGLRQLKNQTRNVKEVISRILKNKSNSSLMHLFDDINVKTFIAELGQNLKESLVLTLENASEALVEYFKKTKERGLRIWAKLEGTIYKSNANVLQKLTRWADEGFAVTYKNIEDGIIISNKKGEEIAEIVTINGEDVLRIADDYFVDGSTQIDKYLDIEFPIKVNSGDEVIEGGRLVLVQGQVKFIEDVSKYGSEIVQRTISRRGKLREILTGILKSQEAHHIIPIQLLKENQIVQKAVEAGFKFNEAINGIPLDKFVKSIGVGRHGPHPKYTEQIRDVFTRLQNMNVNLNPAQSKQLMENLIQGNSKYKGILKVIDDTDGLGPPANKINEIKLGLEDINVLELLGN